MNDRNLIIAFACFIACACFIPAMASVKSCGSASSKFQVQTVYLKPDPPVRGQPVELTVTFTNPGESIADGKVDTSVSINYIPFPSQTTPLCEYTECPILTGSQIRSSQTTWPDNISGRISSKMVWKDSSDNELLCIQMLTNVS